MDRFYVETHTYPHDTEATMFRLSCKVINLAMETRSRQAPVVRNTACRQASA